MGSDATLCTNRGPTIIIWQGQGARIQQRLLWGQLTGAVCAGLQTQRRLTGHLPAVSWEVRLPGLPLVVGWGPFCAKF